MKVLVFDAHQFEKEPLLEANSGKHELSFIETHLNATTSRLVHSVDCVCVFVNDCVSREVLTDLKVRGVKLVALRSAGFNNVDIKAAEELGIKVVRVPEYSPYAVAEHAAGLILCLNRKIHKAYNRVREGNFSLDGLVGFDLHGKTVGVIGPGRIGKAFIKIMKGFGCHVLAYDKIKDETLAGELGFHYSSLNDLLSSSDIISLHLPLNNETFHLINDDAFARMKKGTMLINTGRGGLVDTKALIRALKSGHLGAAGLDVYEEEEKFFFQDFSCEVVDDDILARLMTFPNVILTSHQAFLTADALKNIAETTMSNLAAFENGAALTNEVLPSDK